MNLPAHGTPALSTPPHTHRHLPRRLADSLAAASPLQVDLEVVLEDSIVYMAFEGLRDSAGRPLEVVSREVLKREVHLCRGAAASDSDLSGCE